MIASTLLNYFLSFAVFGAVVAAADQQCYGLNGTKLDDTYGACKPGARHSGCCAINRPAGSVDICLDNGLCMATSNEFMGTIWQDGCTDPTGQDAGCPKMCPDARNDFGGLKKVLAWNIQMCDYGSYCCREVNDHNNCCANATAPRISTTFLGAFQFETSTAGLSSTSTSSAPASTTPTTEPTQVFGTALTTNTPFATSIPSPNLCNAEKRKTAAVGGALGGILGAAVISLLSIIFWMHGKEKRQRKLKEHYEEQFATSWEHRPRTIVVEADTGATIEKDAAEVVYIGKERDGDSVRS